MNLIAVCINHHTAPVGVRESFFLQDDEIKNFINDIKGKFLKEGLVISTCNRTEIYGLPVNQNINSQNLQNFLIEYKTKKELGSEFFHHFISQTAVDHLFSVATGIDSLLIGDNQIFKQVKESIEIAEEMHFSGFLMKRIFDAVIRAGKRAITETRISEGAVTVSYAAVQLIEKIFSTLNKKSALVIGAGETGEIAAKHLVERGIGKLSITNRTFEHAEELAEKLKGKIIPFDNLRERLHEFDIIISATSAENLILTKQDIEAAMKKRNYASMVLMDIAIPRDIDPSSAEIDYVFYHDIDSLDIIVEQNLEKRKAEIPKVKAIIDEEVNNFFTWYNSLEAAPTIKILRDHFETVRNEEVEKNINKFSEADREKLDIITKRIMNKLLHQPTVELKKNSEPGIGTDESAMRISIIRELFGIDKK
ncbi:MAG: glutamyl-tRNA reductase [Ignavibacteria bacterium RBG_16_34_14]|nr:MAG: glutamyl-tRNA reductase [Ignavibacteria bacterium RBG_16_34_14]